jgi:hypothetical protein
VAGLHRRLEEAVAANDLHGDAGRWRLDSSDFRGVVTGFGRVGRGGCRAENDEYARDHNRLDERGLQHHGLTVTSKLAVFSSNLEVWTRTTMVHLPGIDKSVLFSW